MKDAKQFLEEAKAQESDISEVKNQEDWKTMLMDAQVPVILDCYADWCAPCRKLTPILEALTQKYEGKFKLVKLNIDTMPSLASALKVQSIPAVFLIYKGQMVDTFVGIPENKRIGEFVQAALSIESLGSDENMAFGMVTEAEKMITKGDFATAEGLVTELLSHENWREKYGGRSLLLKPYGLVKLDTLCEAFQCIEEFLARAAKGIQDEVPEEYQQWMVEIDEAFQKRTQELNVPD
jgi:thioredoxin